MRRIAALLLVIAAVSCTQRPKVVNDSDITGIRPALAVEYVGVPSMNVYARADVMSPIVGTYGFSESISILARRGEWCEVRTFDGSGWVRAAELMPAEQAKAASEHPLPRFYVAPIAIPYNGRGEIVLQAKVNTTGEVFDVLMVSNSTGNRTVAEANAAALRQARFYPLVEKGQRKTFIYEHRVAY